MLLVSDASVAVKVLVVEPDSAAAERVWDGATAIYAPRLLAAEVANILWSKARRGDIDRDRAADAIDAVASWPVTWVDDVELASDALDIALTIRHPVYDCVYLALARRIDAVLVTADARFANAIAGTEHSGRVMLLSAFAPQ